VRTIDAVRRVCENCLSGRQYKQKFPHKSETRASKTTEQIYSDLVGPMQKPSLVGSRYILVFTDDYSRKSWTFFMKNKADTFDRFRIFKERIELETGKKISCLRTDRGGEYMSNEFKNFCTNHGIKRELTQARTPQQKGVSERRN
jgi:hypothetical protein